MGQIDIDAINSRIDCLMEMKSVQGSHYADELNILKSRLNDKTFRIAVVGEFSSGKSTFINSIIGENILKHAVTETTAAVTYIHNVPRDDIRINTCDIEYVNGEKKHLPDLKQIIEYTTVHSEINVADTIQSVSIYVNFLDVPYPIIIVDTPGLNGMADRHREITLNEIKKAHACIYLLSVSGVKSTDRDFINLLLNYQNRFIFVQNFIDRVDEAGETLQSKIDKDKENLKKCFDQRRDVIYDICGISAVKALASKDKSITKVYDGDREEISDRDALYRESNYQDFEKCLYGIIESGEYLSDVADSALYTLGHIIDRLRDGLDAEIKINEQLRASDDKVKSVERAKEIISRINTQKDDQKKRLDNFMESMDIGNRKSLREYAGQELEQFNGRVSADIDEKIKTYSGLQEFNDRNNANPPEYYSAYIMNYINSNLIPDLRNRIEGDLIRLYNAALLKVSDFTTSVTGFENKVNININGGGTKFDDSRIKLDDDKEQDKIRKNNEKIKQIEDDNLRKQRDISKAISERDKAIENQNRDKRAYNEKKQDLGKDPGVQEKRVKMEKKVKRKGIFRLADFFVGEKTKTYYETELDYSEQNKWKKKMEKLEEDWRQKRENHTKYINKLDFQIADMENKIKEGSSEVKRLKDNIVYLENERKNKKELFEAALKANKEEFCRNEKRKLKEEIQKKLLDGDAKEPSMCENIQKYIDDVDQANFSDIREKVFEQFEDGIKTRLDSLNSFITGNEKELAARYELSRKELDAIDEIDAWLSETQG